MDFLGKVVQVLKRIIWGDPTIGYTIRLHGRDSFLYREGQHQIVIVGEMLTGDVDFAVYVSSIRRWQPPFDKEEIGAEKRELILQRLTTWMSRRKMRYRLEKTPD
jgi:hypothetical protein